MELQYDLNRSDYVEFNLFHFRRSKTGQRALLWQRFVPPVIYLAAAFFLAAVTDLSLVPLMGAAIGLSVIWILFYPAYFEGHIARQVKKMAAEGKNAGLIGPHELTIDEEGIVDVSPGGESRAPWSAIEDAAEDEERFYLYNSAFSAFIIPKRDLEQPEEFRAYLEAKVHNRIR